MVPVKGFDGQIRFVRLAPTAAPGAKNDIVVPVTSAFGRLDLSTQIKNNTGAKTDADSNPSAAGSNLPTSQNNKGAKKDGVSDPSAAGPNLPTLRNNTGASKDADRDPSAAGPNLPIPNNRGAKKDAVPDASAADRNPSTACPSKADKKQGFLMTLVFKRQQYFLNCISSYLYQQIKVQGPHTSSGWKTTLRH